MTIDYHIKIGDSLQGDRLEEVRQTIHATFEEINSIYNKWNPDSELSQLNRLPANVSFKLSPQLALFMERVDHLVKLSENLFDPTIEPLQKLWKEKLELGVTPNQMEINDLKTCVGWHTLDIQNGFFRKRDERTQLDFGGVAKGYCVDLLVERLQSLGLNHLYVEWGGEIRACGCHPSNRPWRVFISRLANPDPNQAIATIDLVNQALATSGDYYQFWNVTNEEGRKKTYCHIFNPKTLRPLEIKNGSVASASLIAPDCMTADALAKVLMLFNSVEEAKVWIEERRKEFPSLAHWVLTRS